MPKLTLLIQLALGLLAVHAVWCLLLFALQERLIFPRTGADPAARPPADADVWQVATSQGPAEAWFFPPTQSGAAPGPTPAVLVAHGNAETIDTFPAAFRGFRDLGMAVLQVEYPGYGRSPGRASQAAVTESLVAAFDRLTARPDVDADRIVLFGRSLGGGAVCALSQERPAAALVLLSTFQSLSAMTRRYLAPAFLLRHPFDSLTAVRRFGGPVLVLHSDSDPRIPHDHAVALSRAAPEGALHTLSGCGHADCPADWNEFWTRVADFLRDADLIGEGLTGTNRRGRFAL